LGEWHRNQDGIDMKDINENWVWDSCDPAKLLDATETLKDLEALLDHRYKDWNNHWEEMQKRIPVGVL